MMNGELVPVLLTCFLRACTPAAHSSARSGARAPAGCAELVVEVKFLTWTGDNLLRQVV